MAEVTDRTVFGGVDTHLDTVHVAVVDGLGRHLDDAEFATTRTGYGQALGWLGGHGALARVGVEGTGSYGLGLATAFTAAGIEVVEVNRPDRSTRRRLGKSDPIDAYAAAQAAASGRASATPKNHTTTIEAIRVIHRARASAVKARTAALNEFHSLQVTAPAALRESLTGLSRSQQLTVCGAYRLGPDRADATTATKLALRRLAQRVRHLATEVTDADTDLDELTRAVAPALRAQHGVGPETAATLLISVGGNPDRVTSEAAMAMLFGVAPLPASSGRTTRHRLNRAGDRQANRAIHTIAISRLRRDPATIAYRDRRLAHGKTRKEILRCLKRYITRELYPILNATLTT